MENQQQQSAAMESWDWPSGSDSQREAEEAEQSAAMESWDWPWPSQEQEEGN